MSKRKRKGQQSAQQPREKPYKPSGPGKVLIAEGERESRHWRNVGGHPLDLAYERGQIAENLHQAGTVYRVLFEKLGRSGLDSTQMIDRSRSGESSPMPFTQCQVDAVRSLQRIDLCMGERDRKIVRRFCGDGMSMTESVYRVTGLPSNAVRYRLIEALETLEDAIADSRRKKVA